MSWEKGSGQRKEKKETWNHISMKKKAVVDGDSESTHSLCLPPYQCRASQLLSPYEGQLLASKVQVDESLVITC